MATGFIRRFLSDPGNAELTAIEGVVIIDREPPASISGVGSGTVTVVAEFEDGAFNTPTEVAGGSDLLANFGGLGYTYDGVASNNVCARSRKADGALLPEYWNGNGFVALVNKRFSRLIVVRVDTSVGSVNFTRLASLSGSQNATFDLEPSQTIVYDLGSGSNTTKTFTAVEARYDSGAGSYPWVPVGGEQITILIDENTPNTIGPVTVTFTSTDTTQAAVVARINAAMGYTCAGVLTSGSTGTTRLSGRVRGLSGRVHVTSIDTAVATATGWAATSLPGTGNVSNIDAVTVGEVNAVVGTTVTADRDANGALRLTNSTGGGTGTLMLVSTSTALTGLGLTANVVSSQPNGFATVTGKGATYSGISTSDSITFSVDGAAPITATFIAGDTTQTNVHTRINTAMGFTFVSALDSTHSKFTGQVNGGSIQIVSANSNSVLVALGLDTGVASIGMSTVTAVTNADQTIPAGTRVRNTGGVDFVTMQALSVRGTGTVDNIAAAGPYGVKVRHALDDGTGLTSVSLSVTTVPFAIPGPAIFTVSNPLPLTAALTESAIDAEYVLALATTEVVSSVVKETNLIACARQSNAVRSALKQNADDASANGCFGRVALITPPLKTTRTVAKSSSQPGVGSYREQRVVYCYPGAQTFVPQIALRGTAGGAGFTSTGLIDTHLDVWVASLCSQLPPEENPGQGTTFLSGIVGLEAGNSDVQNMTIEDYEAFRAKGIAALRIDNGDIFIQSGVTSVDPAVFPNLRNIARRRMADFIQDTLSLRLISFDKRLATKLRRAAILSEIDAFMRTLLSPGNASLQRIDGYIIDGKSGNTPDTLAMGIFRIILKVRTLASLDSIVLDTTIGESVDVSEAA